MTKWVAVESGQNELPTPEAQEVSWWVYLIRTRHDSLYCGATNNLSRRFAAHQLGKGAKSLRGKGPLSIVWQQQLASKVAALQLEYQIKQLPKREKERVVAEQLIFAKKNELVIHY